MALNRISSSERDICLRLASAGIITSVTGRPVATPPEVLSDFGQSIVMGAFVTLKRGDLLRSCCGVLGKPMALGAAISTAALRAAREDQRASPISPCELGYLDLEVTLLSPFKRVEAQGAARAEAVEIGKHGLMIQRGQSSGLLLPSVAAERGWDAVRFLCAVCQKAGLPTDAWQKEDSVLLTFEGLNMSRPLAELMPDGLPDHLSLPLNMEQVAAYSQVAGQNIAAIASGATPSYVVPQLPDMAVNALVLSLLWGDDGQELTENQSRLFQGNAIQVSFRPGVALQSSLFQMSQHAANLFAQQQFSGQLKVGLTVGFDPCMHGFGQKADLTGVDTRQRAVVLSDSRHCGIAFDSEKSAGELLESLRAAMPVGSRDAAVHTVQYLSTMPRAVCVSAPVATKAQGVRAPAVAGKFYPAEDAARRAQVDSLLTSVAPAETPALSAVVPHAGLKYSGKIAARVWQTLQLNPGRTIILVSPKHTTQGVNWAVCPFDAWGLSATTTIAGDPELAQLIAQRVDGFELDAVAHAAEHGIEVQLPILERVAPQSKVVGIAMHAGNWQDISVAAAQMADLLRSIEEPPLMVVSSDMNHYADDAENRRRDRLALQALATGDPSRLLEVCRENEISMCGLVPAAFVMETLRQLGHTLRSEELGYATSADVTGERSRVVGYAGVLLN
jgi:AmmeMemoRadiSam system protein B/AmmeMemoRadiSam system protein A